MVAHIKKNLIAIKIILEVHFEVFFYLYENHICNLWIIPKFKTASCRSKGFGTILHKISLCTADQS